MRCPKCQYLSFDNGDRCRNCGYEFSLAVGPEPLDLAIQDGTEPIGPLADLALNARPAQESAPAAVALATDTGDELPLFDPGVRVDRPLVTPAPPRPPLSVRRGAPPPPKPKPASAPRAARQSPARHSSDEPRLALDTEEMPVFEEPPPLIRPSRREVRAETPPAPAPEEGQSTASAGARIVGAVIDLAIVLGIDAAVLYLTLRVLDLRMADARALPLVPFVAFLVLLDGGYCAAFVAAGGQTIGKMAAGIRVVPGDPGADAHGRVSIGAAIVRAAAYLVSVVPAGIGFLPGVMTSDHRALHDRLADTRVVKA